MAVHGHSRCMCVIQVPLMCARGRFSLVETDVFMQSLILCCIQNEQLKTNPSQED